MPVTASFLATCRTAVSALPELTAFRAALASVGTGATSGARRAAWSACYDDSLSPLKSPAYRLRKAILDTVAAEADIAATLSPLDRAAAYRTLRDEFVPAHAAPPSLAAESAELQQALLDDMLS